MIQNIVGKPSEYLNGTFQIPIDNAYLHLPTELSSSFTGTNLHTLFDIKLVLIFVSPNRYRQSLLRDQKTSPLETALFWTEYVLRHQGAYHLQTPARNMG